MPSLSKYTQWKVIGGYSLLFLLSILAAVLIYKQITKLIVNEENSDNPNRKLFIIGNTITGLYYRKCWEMLLYKPVRDPIF